MPDGVSLVRPTRVLLLDFFALVFSCIQLYSVVCTIESLSLFYLLFYILICIYWEMMQRYMRDLSCESNIYVSCSHLN